MRNLVPVTTVALALAALLLVPRSAQAWSFCPFGLLDFNFGGHGHGYPAYPYGGPGLWYGPEAAAYGPAVIPPPHGPGSAGYLVPESPWALPVPPAPVPR